MIKQPLDGEIETGLKKKKKNVHALTGQPYDPVGRTQSHFQSKQ